MSESWLRKFLKIIGGIAIALLVIPGFVAFATTLDFININTENQWIGFWGSYFGGILGSVGEIDNERGAKKAKGRRGSKKQ